MNKNINKLLISISTFLFSLLALITINDIYTQKKLLEENITHQKNDIKKEYKNRLKDSVKTTIVYIDTVYKRSIQNHIELLDIEIKDIKEHYKNINNYQHKFINITTKATNKLIEKSFKKNGKTYYASIDEKRIYKRIESMTRAFLYKNITEDNRYIWINKISSYKGGDNYAIRLIHPNVKETEGQLLSTHIKDIKGNFPFQTELNGILKNGEIFFEYYFKTINTQKIEKKLSYAKLYKKYDWIIATGIPLTNLKVEVEKRTIELTSRYNNYLIKLFTLAILFMVVYFTLIYIMVKQINKNLKANEELKKEIEEQYKIIESKANNYFDVSLNSLVILNFEGTILEINENSKNILGYNKKDLLGKNIIDYLHKDDTQLGINLLTKLTQGDKIPYYENRFRAKGDKYIYLAWSANVDMEQELIYASALDISKIRTQQELLNQQSKMAAMGEMLGNIAHQWKQPLNLISIHASNILLKEEENLPFNKDEIKNAMIDIDESTKYLSQTIDDFRGFFRPNKEKTSTTTNRLIEKTLRLVSTQLKKGDIEHFVDIESLDIELLENELIQVLINVINNAKDELIKLEQNRYIFISIKKQNNTIEISIKDNAGGIDEKIIKKIFDPYFTTKSDKKGTGIGLHMANEIIRKNLQGDITVANETFIYEDKKYQGALFKITIPLD